MRILLIEDNQQLGEAVSEQLHDDGHAVDWMKSLTDADNCLASVSYELVLLDLMLPDGLGMPFLRQQRKEGLDVSVIILTALDQISDRIEGLNAGADDYLVKPFDLSELSARVAAVSRRYAGKPNPLLVFDDIELDLGARHLVRGKSLIDLTAKEWAVFEALIHQRNRVVSKSRLEDGLYEFGAEIESNAIEAHISRLRKKIGREKIETVRGRGYRLVVSSSS